MYLRQLPKAITIKEKHLNKVKTLIYTLKKQNKLHPWQVSLVALPHHSYLGSQDPILVMNKQGQVSALQESSLVIGGLSDKLEKTYLLFIDREILATAEIQQFL